MQLTVRVHYPEQPELLDALNERAAKAIARAWANELPPQKLDELIEKLNKELNN